MLLHRGEHACIYIHLLNDAVYSTTNSPVRCLPYAATLATRRWPPLPRDYRAVNGQAARALISTGAIPFPDEISSFHAKDAAQKRRVVPSSANSRAETARQWTLVTGEQLKKLGKLHHDPKEKELQRENEALRKDRHDRMESGRSLTAERCWLMQRTGELGDHLGEAEECIRELQAECYTLQAENNELARSLAGERHTRMEMESSNQRFKMESEARINRLEIGNRQLRTRSQEQDRDFNNFKEQTIKDMVEQADRKQAAERVDFLREIEELKTKLALRTEENEALAARLSKGKKKKKK